LTLFPRYADPAQNLGLSSTITMRVKKVVLVFECTAKQRVPRLAVVDFPGKKEQGQRER
jgi:hypothetical protein